MGNAECLPPATAGGVPETEEMGRTLVQSVNAWLRVLQTDASPSATPADRLQRRSDFVDGIYRLLVRLPWDDAAGRCVRQRLWDVIDYVRVCFFPADAVTMTPAGFVTVVPRTLVERQTKRPAWMGPTPRCTDPHSGASRRKSAA